MFFKERIHKISVRLLTLVALALAVSMPLAAQSVAEEQEVEVIDVRPDTIAESTISSITGESARNLLKMVTERYTDWGKVELSGKLNVDKLPVSPSVKIFMHKGKLLQISVRVPFMGEVGRLELDRDSLTVVNKMNKTFCRIGTDHLDAAYPGLLTDVQSLLLGRAIIMGKGELRSKYFKDIEVSADGRGQEYILIPDQKYQPRLCTYGYLADSQGRLLECSVIMRETDNRVTLAYSYEGKKSHIRFSAWIGSKNPHAGLSLDAPKWGGKEMDRFKPQSRYTRVRIGEVLKFK